MEPCGLTGCNGNIMDCLLGHKSFTLQFCEDAFAFIGSEFPFSNAELTPDEELYQWQMRETLPLI